MYKTKLDNILRYINMSYELLQCNTVLCEIKKHVNCLVNYTMTLYISERCSSVKQSQWYDTDCSNIRHDYNRLRNTYNRSKCIEDQLKRDEARTNYKNICKVKFHTYQDQQTKVLYRENMKIKNRIGRKLSQGIKKLRQKSLFRVLKNISNHCMHSNHLLD